MEVEYPCLFFNGEPALGSQALQKAAEELDAKLIPRPEGGETFSFQDDAILQDEAAENRFEFLASKKYRSPEYLYFFLFIILLIAFLELMALNLFSIKSEQRKKADALISTTTAVSTETEEVGIYWTAVSLLPISMFFWWMRNRERRNKQFRLDKIKEDLKKQPNREELLEDLVESQFTVRVNPVDDGGVVVFVLSEPDMILPYLVAKVVEHLPAATNPAVNTPLQRFLSYPLQVHFKHLAVDLTQLVALPLAQQQDLAEED